MPRYDAIIIGTGQSGPALARGFANGAEGGLPTSPAGLPLAAAGECLSLYAAGLLLLADR
jgi:hypothetical protein